MHAIVLNTGTELLLGDVQDAHLAFIACQVFPLGLRIVERRTVSDGVAIRETLAEIFPRAEILFVTGGLGPTTDDVTREAAAELLGLKLIRDPEVMSAILERFATRGIQFTARVERQAFVPAGAEVLPNRSGTAPGLYLRANLNPHIRSPHLFLLPGPPRELQPMFERSVMPILHSIVPPSNSLECRIYHVTGIGESLVEEAIGERISVISGVELGYCSRPGDVDVRIIGEFSMLEQADEIIRTTLGDSIYSMNEATLEEVIVELLTKRRETLSLAESCTGGLLANRITNVPGASSAFLAGYVVTVNEYLSLELIVTNKSATEKFEFENCLHTYFFVEDIAAISLHGLKGVTYLDKTANQVEKVEAEEAIRISSEVDRTYLNATSAVEIRDARAGRAIRVEKKNSASTVVWNPWIAKAQQMTDFGNEEYRNMVCVESGNVASNKIVLGPRETSWLKVKLSTAPLA